MQDGVNELVWVYFVVLIIFGSFFAVNLALAVLYLQFTQAQADLELAHEEAERHSAPPGEALQASTDAPPRDVPVTRWRALRRACFHIQASPYCEGVTLTLIILNTLVMASSYASMSRLHVKVREPSMHQPCRVVGRQRHGPVSPACEGLQIENGANLAFTVYFAVEMLVKLAGLGVRGYWSDGMNAFDGVVVVASVVELILSATGHYGASLSVFRAFRLMRVFKLAKRWKELNTIVRSVMKSLTAVSYLSLLLLLFVFMMALLGMQLFGHR